MQHWREPMPLSRVRQIERPNRLFIYALVIACISTLAWWIFFYSGHWDIKQIDISPLQTLNREEVITEVERLLEQTPWRPWHRKNLLIFSATRVEPLLKDRLFVDEVQFEKQYPDVLRLMIKERRRSVMVYSQEQFANVDHMGVVTGLSDGALSEFPGQAIQLRTWADDLHDPVIVTQTADPLSTGFRIASTAAVQSWLEVSRRWLQDGVKYHYMMLDTPESRFARFKLDKDLELEIDLQGDQETQMMMYEAFLKTKPNLGTLKRIDVRVPGKIFVE